MIATFVMGSTIKVKLDFKSRAILGAMELTIGEVAERAGVATSKLRFYEREGLITSTRSTGGQRRYHRDVLRRVAFVRAAQQVGLTLVEIRAALDRLPGRRTPTAQDWERLSASWRPVVEARIAELERLRDRLDSCIGCGCLSLKSCALSNPGDVAASLGPGARWIAGDSDD
jgi:MerR family redox-sensitive transcriptional activator SoxR